MVADIFTQYHHKKALPYGLFLIKRAQILLILISKTFAFSKNTFKTSKKQCLQTLPIFDTDVIFVL